MFTFVLGFLTAVFVYRAVMTEVVNHSIVFRMSAEARAIRHRRWLYAILSLLAFSYRVGA